ncbi:DUF4131 domain-containing protein, partial [Candidatus Pacearchaeota archaeon]|nr:DUF4131 domain-containing protein [Candidatus Pacearchaeota archaeon]
MLYQFVVSFVLGIIFAKFFYVGWPVALLVVLVSVVVFLFLSRPRGQSQNITPKIFLIIGLAFALGILRIGVSDNSPDSNFSKLVGQKVSFEATISEEPDVRDTSARYTVKPVDSKSLILLITDRFPEFQYGDNIKVSGKLDLPKNFQNDNGTEFDYISYLSKDKIHFLIYRPSIDPTSSGSAELRGTRKIVSVLYSIKNIFIKNISAVVPEPNSSLLDGVIFGA